ncbi:MAG TPA: ATP cone domain-containing protein [Flavobacterium sp.]|nr:ATP cone domain-containing protein [Flavobacterium sp.]
MKVTKYSGEIVSFNRDKLKNSLMKTGADTTIVEEVLRAIEKELYEGIPTKKIYRMAFKMLKAKSNVHAARYNLRNAIQALGPAGFFFEKFISELFADQGYEVRTNIILQGRIVSHEIDVLIKQNDWVEMIECKFQSSQDSKNDVKVPMYILSRFNDLKGITHSVFEKGDTVSGCRIVTNNRFTEDAIKFGESSGLKLLGWNYPKDNGLKDLIDSCRLYPITVLTTLTLAEKDKLLMQQIIMVKDLIKKSYWLQKIGLSNYRITNVLKEANGLCPG